MAIIFPIPPDSPHNVEFYIDKFDFLSKENYEIGITNVDKDLLDWKYEPNKICTHCIECFTENTASEVYNRLISDGRIGLGLILKTNNGNMFIGATKVFALVKANHPDL